jgi:hypothetical protein
VARPLVSPLIAYRHPNRTGPPAGNSRESFRLLPRIDIEVDKSEELKVSGLEAGLKRMLGDSYEDLPHGT